MKTFIETERLILRAFVLEDVDGLFALDSDPEVHRYLGNKPITEKEQALETIKYVQQQYVENGIGRWAIIEKSTNNFIGWSGIKLVKEPVNQHVNFYDIGYRLLQKYWGQGFASESAFASLAYGFNELHLNEIYAAANVDNIGSNTILRKIGMQFVETFYYEAALQNWYKIEKFNWQKKIIK
jgi:[ribosomal protein S5]-alanine N-acetyltransferase